MTVPTLCPVVVDALSDARRRAVLAVLFEQGETVSVATLVQSMSDRHAAEGEPEFADDGSHSGTFTDGGSAGDESADCDGSADSGSTRAVLHHTHLPALAEAGAVVYDPDTGLVRCRHDSPFDREWVRKLVAAHPKAGYDRTLSALASQRRQFVLSELFRADGPLAISEVALAVAARERECEPADVPAARHRATELALQHTHLPHLVDAGLAARGATGAVEQGNAPWHAEQWVTASPIAEWAALG